MNEIELDELSKRGIFALWQSPHSGAPVAILAHGIDADHTEGRSEGKPGLFDMVVERLSDHGVATLRFDFRGHGESSPVSGGVTIESEVEDLHQVLELIPSRRTCSAMISCSFGACATSQIAASAGISAAVYLNPVVDPYATFFDPGTCWSRQSIGAQGRQILQNGGRVLLDGEFPLERSFLDSVVKAEVSRKIAESKVPTLFAHGYSDSYVDWSRTRDIAVSQKHFSFVSIDSEHGFGDLSDGQFIASIAADFVDRFSREGR